MNNMLSYCGLVDASLTKIYLYDSDPTEELVKEEKKSGFWKDVCNFAKIGLEISTTVHGPDHSETVNWRKRNEDPVKYHREENWEE